MRTQIFISCASYPLSRSASTPFSDRLTFTKSSFGFTQPEFIIITSLNISSYFNGLSWQNKFHVERSRNLVCRIRMVTERSRSERLDNPRHFIPLNKLPIPFFNPHLTLIYSNFSTQDSRLAFSIQFPTFIS